MPGPRRQRLRERAFRLAKNALYWSGACHAYLRATGTTGAVILMYHSVPDDGLADWIDPRYSVSPDRFRQQLRFLAKRRRVISMRDLVEAKIAGRELGAGSVVLTFDDGYLDNAVTAAPILEEFGMPATFYLATGYVDRIEPQWIDHLYGTFMHRERHVLELGDFGLARWDLSAKAEICAAYEAIELRLRGLPWRDRRDLLEAVDEQLRPTEGPPRRTMAWDDVRRLVANPLFQVGGHTRNHVDLSACSEEESRSEVLGCLEDILGETGNAAQDFSYPYGRFDQTARDVLVEAGVRSATVTEPSRPIRSEQDIMAWPRFDACVGPTQFCMETSGACPDLPIRLFGRS